MSANLGRLTREMRFRLGFFATYLQEGSMRGKNSIKCQ